MESYQQYCKQIEKQILQQTGIQLQAGSNLNYKQYCQLRSWIESTDGENKVDIVYRPQIIVINSSQGIPDGPPEDDTNKLGSSYDQDDNISNAHDAGKVEGIRLCNEEIFVYTNQLTLGLPQSYGNEI